jgi:hypothetical protein
MEMMRLNIILSEIEFRYKSDISSELNIQSVPLDFGGKEFK